MSEPAEHQTRPLDDLSVSRHSMFEESEREDFEIFLNDRPNRNEVKSGTSSQDVWLAKSAKKSRKRSKSNEPMKRPRSLEDLSKLVPNKKEHKAGQKQGSSKSKERRPRSDKSRSKSRNGSRSLSPKRSLNSRSKLKSLDGGSKHRIGKTKKSDGKDDELDSGSTHSYKKDSSSKSLDTGSRHRSRNANSDRSNDEFRAIAKKYQQSKSSDREREDNETKKRARRARTKSPVPKSRSRDTNNDKKKETDAKDDELDSRSTHSQKKDSSFKSLDTGSRHRSRKTKKSDGKDDELDSRSTHSQSRLKKDLSSQQSKSSDREREDNEIKKRARRARSKSPVPQSRSRDTNDDRKKELRGKRAVRPGVERSSSHRSMEDAKECRSRGATAVSNSSENDPTNKKAMRQTHGLGSAQRVEGAKTDKDDDSRSVTSVYSQSTSEDVLAKRHDYKSHLARRGRPEEKEFEVNDQQPGEGVALHAEAVDEDMNARIIQEQVQAVLNKMTSDRISGPDVTERDSDSDSEDSRPCMTGPRWCILVVLFIIAGIAGGLFALRAARVKPAATDAPTGAPTTTAEIVPSPTTPSLINEDNCVALKGDADIVSFDIQMEILVDDEGNYAGTLASIVMAIQQDIVPGLTGCAQTVQRRLQESFRYLRRTRYLQNSSSSLANVTGDYGDSGSCGANVTNVTDATNMTDATNATNATSTFTTDKFCRSLTLTIDAATKADSNSSEMILLIQNALNSEKLDLPGNSTIGQLEVYALTTRSPSSMPSSTTAVPTTIPTAIPTITLSQNPTRAPVSWPTTDEPTRSPSKSPSPAPSPSPTLLQSQSPTRVPSAGATPLPTMAPSPAPTAKPSVRPSLFPTESPTDTPSVAPSASPSTGPLIKTSSPSTSPSVGPSVTPPSTIPTLDPTGGPTSTPSTISSTSGPTTRPTETSPSFAPSSSSSADPTLNPIPPLSYPPTPQPTAAACGGSDLRNFSGNVTTDSDGYRWTVGIGPGAGIQQNHTSADGAVYYIGGFSSYTDDLFMSARYTNGDSTWCSYSRFADVNLYWTSGASSISISEPSACYYRFDIYVNLETCALP